LAPYLPNTLYLHEQSYDDSWIFSKLKGVREQKILGNTVVDFSVGTYKITPRRYPYFDVVVGLVWSHDPKSYAGGSVCYW
jgi:hypothetical protein